MVLRYYWAMLCFAVVIKESFQGWKTITKDVRYSVEMKKKLLKFRTETDNSSMIVGVEFRESGGKIITLVKWRFSDYKVGISDCTADYAVQMVDVPETGTEKNWTLYQTKEGLGIGCNNVKVLWYNAKAEGGDCKDNFNDDKFKRVLFPSEHNSVKINEVAFQYEILDYYIYTVDDTTSVGVTGTVGCQVVTPDKDTKLKKLAWKLGTILTLDWTETGEENATFPMSWDDVEFNFTLLEAPGFTSRWTCFFELDLKDEDKQNITGIAVLNILLITMTVPKVMIGSPVVVQCNISNTDLDVVSPVVQWAGVPYNSTTAIAAGLNITLGDYDNITNSRMLTMDVPKENVTLEMAKDFICEATIKDRLHSTAGVMQFLGFIVQPLALLETLDSMNVELNCTLESMSYVGTMVWWKENATSPGNFTAMENTDSITVPDTNFTSWLKFTNVLKANESQYYCNVTFNATDSFGGGNAYSEKSVLKVIEEGTEGYCWIKNCYIPTAACVGEFYEISTKPCAYIISIDTKNDRNTTTKCGEPTAGCAATSTRSNTATVNLTGTGSSLISKGDAVSELRVYGNAATIETDLLAADDGENIESSDNKAVATCLESTSDAEGCSVNAISGKYGTYACFGAYCKTTVNGLKSSTAYCNGDNCVMTDTNVTDSYISCGSNNCSIVSTAASDSTIYVTSGATGATVNIVDGSSLIITTDGDNHWSQIYCNSTNMTTPECTGNNCQVTTELGHYSTSKCTGFNCSAIGVNITNLGTAITVTCNGRDCLAQCIDSSNCTAYCNGYFCRSECANNTYCNAICNGRFCTTTCTVKPGQKCDELRLPKKSICENCLHAPMIWNWTVCMADYPTCQSCYVARFDLLGLELYKMGCLDNKTEVDACTNNTFIHACYLDYCAVDYCTRDMVAGFIIANTATRICNLNYFVVAASLTAYPAVVDFLASSLLSLVHWVYKQRRII